MGQNRAAESRYWQLRLIVSWGARGQVDWTLSGKDYQDRWQDMRHLQRGMRRLGHEPKGTIVEGLESMELILRSDLLPPRNDPDGGS